MTLYNIGYSTLDFVVVSGSISFSKTTELELDKFFSNANLAGFLVNKKAQYNASMQILTSQVDISSDIYAYKYSSTHYTGTEATKNGAENHAIWSPS